MMGKCALLKIGKYIAIALALLLGAFILRPAVFFYPAGALLARNDHPAHHAEQMIMLMGEPSIRPMAAARAMREGMARQIIFVSTEASPLEELGLMPTESEIAKTILLRSGIHEAQIHVVSQYGQATSTTDEARILRTYCENLPVKPQRLIVITSWPHSSRAGWVMDKVFEGSGIRIEMLPIEKVPFELNNWWQSERGLIFVFEEYVKWVRYLLKYLGRNIN